MKRLLVFLVVLLLLPLTTACFEPTITIINDMHVDPETRRATVYAQTLALGDVVAPPQVGPGECTQSANGETVCFHPNAVYLDGSGQELDAENGGGAWWIKHSWVVDGEGYENCEARPQETYDDCFQVEGIMLDDGLTMQVGGTGEGGAFFNQRKPLLENSPVAYEVVRFSPDDDDPQGDAKERFRLNFDCTGEQSAFDGRARPCPTSTNASDVDNLALHDGYWVTEVLPSDLQTTSSQ
ncbi:MAG: hypothetical protein GY822_24045 [Deltaproteobacteria bacterium]|nr:hypothetical protein [Deltaproteobacteria bacterium]